MQVKDVMTSPVISVEPDASIWQAVRIMLQRRISGLPVIDKHGRLVGMVSEGSFAALKPGRSGDGPIGSGVWDEGACSQQIGDCVVERCSTSRVGYAVS